MTGHQNQRAIPDRFNYVVLCAFMTIAGTTMIGGIQAQAETIRGNACYRFSDNESITAARDIALSLAKRDALEKYSVFVEATSTVENTTLKNDLITSIGAGFLKNLKIVTQSENLTNREVCREIAAEVEPFEIKQQMVAKVNAFRRNETKMPTGLPENNSIRVLKAEKEMGGEKRFVFQGAWRTVNCSGGCIRVSALCKKKIISSYDIPGVRVIFVDQNGVPEKTEKFAAECQATGDINYYYLPLPPGGYTFSVEVFEQK